ncbi:MAG: hypothetical protein ACR2JC_00120 [Chloroflexota bacterium]|nr:MAG: hypothetical protein DLM70_02170 [Chloroflexota bacterium]
MLSAAAAPYVQGQIAPAPSGDVLRGLRGHRAYMSYKLDLPPNAGLAASTAQRVVWVALQRVAIANTADRQEVARAAAGVDAALDDGAGAADAYACALGGITFCQGGETTLAESIHVPPAFLHGLGALLTYTGPAPPVRTLQLGVQQRLENKGTDAKAALDSMKELARHMRDVFVAKNVEQVFEDLNSHWQAQKRLVEGISSPAVDDILTYAFLHGAAAGKLCGAGGGGFLLLLTHPDRRPSLKAALLLRRLHTIDLAFDSYGVQVSRG